ncbi:MAG: peptide chain release factor 1 [Coxiellaceae bacterium]|jgi:peptide chain release factor 1|nr:peptide chain release factor 1 [Coxiellaceae bacterium]
MQPSIINKLTILHQRHQEISDLLARPETVNNQNLYRELSKEYAYFEPVVSTFEEYNCNRQKMLDTEKILQEEHDPDLKSLATEDLFNLKQNNQKLIEKLRILLLPHDPNDERNIFLEIRAGTGGDEAAIFAGDLFRMYSRYIADTGWQIEIINSSAGEHGGYKEIISRVIGKGVYSKLKFESGVHRVQRVPTTEAQGRIHTSACTVAVIAEADEIDSIEINPADLKIDTFRSSGAGGQHVNVTDSAIRITHLPSGVVVECQDERSQHKNRARAMSLLKAKLLAAEQEKQRKEQAETRRSMVGTGDRSERIRTYNFPQGRLTDHRINLTLYQLDKIMEGDLKSIIEPLIQEYNAKQLAEIS